MARDEAPVLIVGAGPVGLTLAIDLAWRGIDVMVVETRQRAQPPEPKCNHVAARTMEIFRQWGIERAIRTKKTQGSSMEQLADLLKRRGKEVDRLLAPLRELNGVLSTGQLRQVVDAHGALDRMISEITRDRRSTRSFVSKYMHFHCPVVPMFDSYAQNWIPKLIRMNNGLRVLGDIGAADVVYFEYVLRFFGLYELIRKDDPRVSVRLVDGYILAYAYGRSVFGGA